MSDTVTILPRLIRLRDAPVYMGMDRSLFERLVRPYVTEMRLSTQAVAFDRLELDAWAEEYKRRNGRPAKEEVWDARKPRGSTSAKGSGTSTSKSSAAEFEQALEQATSKKRKRSSRAA